MYPPYLYFLGRSTYTSKALVIFRDENKRTYVSAWNWIQRFGSCQISKRKKRESVFIIDETVIQIGNHHFWLWTCIELVSVLCLESTFQKRETCLLLKNLLDHLLRNTEDM